MNASIHPAQNSILRDLLFTPQASYSELQKNSGLESDHFKFHLGRLVELGYVEKVGTGKYVLSTKGKEYANKLDTSLGKIERQPKAAVIIVLQDERGRFLLQERLKHPYFGFWGYPGGKIRWGETILQAGARELFEETGLDADLAYQGVYHEHVVEASTHDILEDKIFHILSGKNPSGELVAVFEGGKNAWLTEEELSQKEKKYASCDIESRMGTGQVHFIEAVQMYTKDEF